MPIPFGPPDFGPTVTQAKAPPPIGAATVVVTADGTHAVASDPDRDRIVIADLASKTVKAIALAQDDEPGRLVEDAAKRVHVVLHRSGMVATVDVASGAVVERRAVCPDPQGIAVDGERLLVTCASGEIDALPVAGGAATSFARLDPDLRDIVVTPDALLVSRLRSAELIRVAKSDGSVLSRIVPPARASFKSSPRESFVAWRLAKTPAGVLMAHQTAQLDEVDVKAPNGYAGHDCDGVVSTTVTGVATNGDELSVVLQANLLRAVLPVDIAFSPDGRSFAVVAAGNGHTPSAPQVLLAATDGAEAPPEEIDAGFPGPPCIPGDGVANPPGQVVAVTYTPDATRLVAFSREPAAFHVRSVAAPPRASWTTIAAGGASREDTGHAIFHSDSGGGIACVSCHPGGADDGRVWRFTTGARRTQTLQGTLAGTEPYHWNGDVPKIEDFATEVFVRRMAGQPLAADQVDALRAWLTRIPAPPRHRPRDVEAAARGQALFEDPGIGCSDCHAGPKLTNSDTVDVGTGGSFQVPSLLGLGVRAPYLHDGRAKTLLDRFGASGGGDMHGNTSGLSAQQIADLIAWLETL